MLESSLMIIKMIRHEIDSNIIESELPLFDKVVWEENTKIEITKDVAACPVGECRRYGIEKAMRRNWTLIDIVIHTQRIGKV
jgi:hypothetical protein